MSAETEVLIVGAGPAGASAAIRLARAGWEVTLIEQQPYPRHKVCGECISAGSWALLDELGVGCELRQLAGGEIRQVGWMREDRAVSGQMPACREEDDSYGRALGRNYLDAVLLERARSLGVTVLQPARALGVTGEMGCFECRYELRPRRMPGASQPRREKKTLRASWVIDAHGSWERELTSPGVTRAPDRQLCRSGSELLAFKARFRDAKLRDGYLPVISFKGGYGGMVLAGSEHVTLACCLRRDVLEKCRRDVPRETAGIAVEAYLLNSCRGIAAALRDARRDGAWLAVGPIRPGVRVTSTDSILRIGNAAGETHPLIGEGIALALQSAAVLAAYLGRPPAPMQRHGHYDRVRRAYASVWRPELASRLRISQLYAYVAMNRTLACAAQKLFTRQPGMLTFAALLAGKARSVSSSFNSGAA